jgi:hypothetical protein
LESEGELISALHTYEIRFSLAHQGIMEINLAKEGTLCIREIDLRRINLGFVREKFYRETEKDFQQRISPFPGSSRVTQGARRGRMTHTEALVLEFAEAQGFQRLREGPYFILEAFH